VTEAVPETEPDVVAPFATPVAVPVKVADVPDGALPGTEICACIWVFWFATSVPSVHACVPSPLPQMVKVGAAKLLGFTEICTVTLLAVPPVGQTSTANWPFCPGCTVLVTDCTLMHSCVTVADPEGVTPGVRLGEGPGGDELGDDGSDWHTPVAACARLDWTPARAAAAVPTQSTATPATAANTVDPVRPLRRGTPG